MTKKNYWEAGGLMSAGWAGQDQAELCLGEERQVSKNDEWYKW